MLYTWDDLPHHDTGAIALSSTNALDNTACFEKYDASEEGLGIGVRVKAKPANAFLVNGKLPAGTYVGAYPGRIYTADMWDAALEKNRKVGRSGKKVSRMYAMDFFDYRQETGNVIGDLVIDPSDDSGLYVAHEYAHHLTPYINEPSGTRTKARGHPNCFWVRNYPMDHSLDRP